MINGIVYQLHRIIYFAFHQDWDINNLELQIDHINMIKHDNRIENLRAVSHQQNTFNTNAKGYTFNKKWNRFQGQINLNGKKYSKNFNTEIEAREWYLEQKKILHII